MDKEDVIKVLTQYAEKYSDTIYSELASTFSIEQLTLFQKWRVWSLIEFNITAGYPKYALHIFEQFKNVIDGDKVLNAFKEKEHP